jgi:hypothetical protein
LPGWQQFYATHIDRGTDFELVSVAIDHAGPEAPRRYVEAAELAFPTVIDQHAILSRRLGFKVVPNGLLLDQDGTIRWAKYGGFSVDNPEDISVVERFFAGDDPGLSPDANAPYALGPLELELIETKVRLGQTLLELQRTGEAVAAWRGALHLDPMNFTLRKQIWAAEHPEKFHPAIDFDWQQIQLAREREQEIAAGICGPDGCPLPWTSQTRL